MFEDKNKKQGHRNVIVTYSERKANIFRKIMRFFLLPILVTVNSAINVWKTERIYDIWLDRRENKLRFKFQNKAFFPPWGLKKNFFLIFLYYFRI